MAAMVSALSANACFRMSALGDHRRSDRSETARRRPQRRQQSGSAQDVSTTLPRPWSIASSIEQRPEAPCAVRGNQAAGITQLEHPVPQRGRGHGTLPESASSALLAARSVTRGQPSGLTDDQRPFQKEQARSQDGAVSYRISLARAASTFNTAGTAFIARTPYQVTRLKVQGQRYTFNLAPSTVSPRLQRVAAVAVDRLHHDPVQTGIDPRVNRIAG